jgi:hypothetical protein
MAYRHGFVTPRHADGRLGHTDDVASHRWPLHTLDRRWWWNGTTWIRAYSADGRWWFDGFRWTPVAPARRRWTFPTGLVVVGLGVAGLWVGGLASMGDPAPGQDKTPAAWLAPVALASVLLIVIGAVLASAATLFRMYVNRRLRPPT